ncbi:hypothetical protein F4821DRAFT_252601 [Hypoxylon rubiginosum]|uniref:Uncharacterized protein n=1 Tax=Hypoxylon rubiginosum TaxID=110542 RepID=A0ACC0DMJ8_9PEZI|nr:hypothetical protein F4821DRAFT_252601 [Hypoxylon rubiginosum]
MTLIILLSSLTRSHPGSWLGLYYFAGPDDTCSCGFSWQLNAVNESLKSLARQSLENLADSTNFEYFESPNGVPFSRIQQSLLVGTGTSLKTLYLTPRTTAPRHGHSAAVVWTSYFGTEATSHTAYSVFGS